MPHRVFVTGAGGFVGTAVTQRLVAGDHDVTVLAHRRPLQSGGDRVRTVRGDLSTPAALDDGLAGCSAVIHLVGIIRENKGLGVTFDRVHHLGTKNMLAAASRAGVRRFIHMSALGARSDAASEYHRSKFKAEQAVRDGGLDWTIFQPSLIHGPDGEFLKMLAGWARGKKPPFVFMPYFGGGLLGLRRPRACSRFM